MSDSTRRLFPLDEYYRRAEQPLPPVTWLEGPEMPQPYRQLLVHRRDMTPTLESFHGECIELRVLERRREANRLARAVVLTLRESRRPVEFGAIVIHCDRFPAPARELILESRCPLGTILSDHEIRHTSAPIAYFQVVSDEIMNQAFALPAGSARRLYGRRNVLADLHGSVLADVVEILPPVD